MARKWTTEEIEYLREHYPLLGLEAVSKVLQRTKNAVGAKARRLELKARNATVEEDAEIRAAILSGMPESEISAVTDRTPRFIRARADVMDLGERLKENRAGAYTSEDIAAICSMAEAGSTADQIAAALERTSTAIRCYCRRNEIALVDARVKPGERLSKRGCTKTRGAPNPAYTEYELAILRKAAEDGLTAKEIIERLPGRTAVGVYLKARSLGLDIPRVRHNK